MKRNYDANPKPNPVRNAFVDILELHPRRVSVSFAQVCGGACLLHSSACQNPRNVPEPYMQ